MDIFKKKDGDKKVTVKRTNVLESIVHTLTTGEPNAEVEHIRKVNELAGSDKFKNKFNIHEIDAKLEKDNQEFLKLIHDRQENFAKVKALNEREIKKAKKSWFYKMKLKTKVQLRIFKDKLNEIWSFIKHEFHTTRKLVFLINDLFFGKERKNRKLFYNHKKTLIEKNGYYKGEVRYNKVIKQLTKAAEINHNIIQTHG